MKDEFVKKLSIFLDLDKDVKGNVEAIRKLLNKEFKMQISSIGKNFLSSLSNVFKNAWMQFNDTFQSSFLTNATTRDNIFGYGFSMAESYGFEQAKQLLGIQSEEDLWYMNNAQKTQFQNIMTKYAERYSTLYDSGFFNDYLDYQIAMEEFKLDVQTEIIEFFMANKDTIKTFMTYSIKALEVIVNAISWITDRFNPGVSVEAKTANISDIVNGGGTRNVINQTFSNNNTFNGTTDSQKQAYLDMLSAQMIEAKKGLGG